MPHLTISLALSVYFLAPRLVALPHTGEKIFFGLAMLALAVNSRQDLRVSLLPGKSGR